MLVICFLLMFQLIDKTKCKRLTKTIHFIFTDTGPVNEREMHLPEHLYLILMTQNIGQ